MVTTSAANFEKLVVQATEQARVEEKFTNEPGGATKGTHRDALASYIGDRMKRNKQGTVCMIAFGGTLGVFLPGVPSWPLFVMGVAYLAPEGSSAVRMDNWVHRKIPVVRVEMISFMDRFLTDFERRFPESVKSKADAIGASPHR